MAIDTGATAWILVSTALVMLMTPGVGLFYGGLVRKKNFIDMITLSLSRSSVSSGCSSVTSLHSVRMSGVSSETSSISG